MIQRRAAVLVSLALVACGRPADGNRQPAADSGAAPPVAAQRPVVLFLGTSLTAGLGVDPDSAYPAVIQRRLDSLGLALRVVNGGVSGETSAGLRRRLGWALDGALKLVVIETGANDGLRGLDVDSTRANITAIVDSVRRSHPGVMVVLAGMEAPPNMGPRFTGDFRRLFPDLASRKEIPLIPFLLEGVAGIDSLNQQDGIHPTPAGHRIVADNVWRVIGPQLMLTATVDGRR